MCTIYFETSRFTKVVLDFVALKVCTLKAGCHLILLHHHTVGHSVYCRGQMWPWILQLHGKNCTLYFCNSCWQSSLKTALIENQLSDQQTPKLLDYNYTSTLWGCWMNNKSTVTIRTQQGEARLL